MKLSRIVEIHLFYATREGEIVPNKVKRANYIIEVEAYADVGGVQRAIFHVYVKDEILKCEGHLGRFFNGAP